jgi:hypothetical protein
MVTAGSIHTALLRNSRAVSPSRTRQVLAFIEGTSVTIASHPRPRGVSPALLTGVDCDLLTHTGRRLRGVGTLVSRGVLTGGHIAQGSAWTSISTTQAERRMPWSHYVGRPGTLHVIGKFDAADLSGHLRDGPGMLDLGAAAEERVRIIQRHPDLDHVVPMRARRATVRWLTVDDQDAPIRIRFVDRPDSHGVELMLPAVTVAPEALAALCEEIALRHWLLTTLLEVVQQAHLQPDPGPRLRQLAPVLDHLAHLWLTPAHLDACLTGMLRAIDDRVGMTVQWRTTIDRVRDQFALASVAPSLR